MIDYLIVARSGRAIAASAKQAGYKVSVADYFADEDTKSLSESVHQLQYHCDGFEIESLLGHIEDVISDYPDAKLVLGSGFEDRLELLDSVGKLAPVLANCKGTVLRLKEPISFCEILDKEGIKHPHTTYSRPIDSKKYLVKKVAGIGGEHVSWFENNLAYDESGFYYQEYIKGIVSSVVFLADGLHAHIVGFNQQLQTDQFVEMPFLYLGAMTTNEVSPQHKTIIQKIINSISAETGLKGLCGLDYIVDEFDEVIVLEVNPRPPATFELHETTQSLFDAHLSCFDGLLTDYNCLDGEEDKYKGYVIFYANKEIKISDKIVWPLWVKDRPSSESVIALKFPVCTVHAEENSMDKLKSVLFNRLKEIESIIVAMQNAA
ncbi:MAG TPA: ATP-grasp domain-containing protein [Thiotrichaceae bacterium]|jgi:predicted ATP-grasp superfamily ATP-dependent carboligase|nr:ATP-grasp domain-containing protein [Thiotrichaceae bacterium]HIM08138.1 ATP-grasp domain-containing protein [Gammaproteobacteria bacterium]